MDTIMDTYTGCQSPPLSLTLYYEFYPINFIHYPSPLQTGSEVNRTELLLIIFTHFPGRGIYSQLL